MNEQDEAKTGIDDKDNAFYIRKEKQKISL